METLLAAGVALYAYLSRSTSSGPDPRTDAGGTTTAVVVPGGPVVPTSSPVVTERDAAQIAAALGKVGKGAAAIGTGFTVGLGVGELVANDVLVGRKEVAPYTTAATPWAFGAAGAGVGVAVAVGALTVSVSAVAFVAFPIAVAVLAVIDVAGNIEMSIRRTKERERYNEILALTGQGQFRRAWELAVSSVEHDEMPWMVPKRVRGSLGGLITETELGDSPTVVVESKPTGMPGASSGPQLGTVTVTNGNTVRVAEAIAAAYKPVIEAFARDRASMAYSWSRSARAQELWLEAHAEELAVGDAIALALGAAQPWWAPGSFRWRPPFPTAPEQVDAIARTGVAVVDAAAAQTDAGAGKVATANTRTASGETDSDAAARSGTYGPKRLAGGGDW